MIRNTFAARLFLLALVCAGLNTPAATAVGAAEPSAPVALVSAAHHQLEWAPLGDFESITLALADPQGLVRFHRFGPGEAPILSLFDAQGMPLPDGTYTWELRMALRRSAGRPAAPLVQSGSFTISNGRLVPPDLTEPSEKVITAEDQVVPDDLIVDGKGCIGLGCANNEAFGAEALRLKQSVVRLRFEDTSTTAGLPTRDWQFTVNDAASGGADRFSVDDLTAGTTPFTVRGGAPSNSLYVDGVGNVGLGTATPAQDLHVTSGSTPTLRLEQTGGTVRTWDMGASNASFFVKDVTNGSAIPFRINAGAPADTLVIAASGQVVLSRGNPVPLHLFGTVDADLVVGMGPSPLASPAFNFGYGGATFGRSSGFLNVRADASATPPNPSLRFWTADTPRMIIDNEGFLGLGSFHFNPAHPIHQETTGARLTTGGMWQNGSSRDLKQDIRELPADEALSALGQLVPVRFRYKVELNDESLGFIAEDVPDLVATPDRKTLSSMDIVAVLTRVVQEQEKRIAELEAALAGLRSQAMKDKSSGRIHPDAPWRVDR